MKIENIPQTITNTIEGLQATSENEVVPIYYDGELANGAAIAAFRFKRIMGQIGSVAGRALEVSFGASVAAVEHVAKYGGTGQFGE
jgi:hypothetical protein